MASREEILSGMKSEEVAPLPLDIALVRAFNLGAKGRWAEIKQADQQLSHLADQVLAGDALESQRWRRKVRQIAERYQVQMGWCDSQFNEAMEELDLPPISRRVSLLAEVDVHINPYTHHPIEPNGQLTEGWLREYWDRTFQSWVDIPRLSKPELREIIPDAKVEGQWTLKFHWDTGEIPLGESALDHLNSDVIWALVGKTYAMIRAAGESRILSQEMLPPSREQAETYGPGGGFED